MDSDSLTNDPIAGPGDAREPAAAPLPTPKRLPQETVGDAEGGGCRPAPGAPPAGTEVPALDRFWTAIRRLPRYARLATYLARDPRVPRSAKATLAFGGAYVVSPIDLIPGIIPVAGQLDDLLVLLLALRRAIHACPPAVAAEHLSRAGLTDTDIDADLRAARDTARWLAVKGARATGRMAMRSGRWLRSRWPHRRRRADSAAPA